MGNAILTNIDGLENVTSVSRFLEISDNPALTNINSLINFTSVEGRFTIQSNSALTNIDGLANVTSMGEEFLINNNNALTDIDGLANLTSVASKLRIIYNSSLTNVDGLANITNVGSLVISKNAALANIDGLNNLTNVTSHIEIYDNTVLSNLFGLANISQVSGNLIIHSNVALSNLFGLVNISSVAGDLDVYDNDALSNCSPLAPLLGWPVGPPDDNVGGLITVGNNDFGCSSVQEILDSVTGPTAPTITTSEVMGGKATLTFSPSTTTDTIWPITGYQAQCLSDDQSTFENNTITDIPDLGSVISPLIVSGIPFNNAAGLNVSVNITHPRTRHLTLILTSPSGTSVVLWDEAEGTGADLIGAFPTNLEPAESLDAFDGEDFNGEWLLTVADGLATQIGTLNSWGITVRDKVTATAEIPPVTLTGLTNFHDYTCTVSAITGLGIGPASNTVSVYSKATPTGIRATNGTYSNRVEVTWDSVIGATVYRLFRCAGPKVASCGLPIRFPKETFFNDTKAIPGKVYYYRLRACTKTDCGPFSVERKGSINIGFVAPTNVIASDGTYSDRVHITWKSVEGPTVFRVFRCLDRDISSCSLTLGFPKTTSFNDTKGDAGTVYYYRIRGCIVNTCSNYSFANAGHRGNSTASIESESEMQIDVINAVPIPTINDVGRWLLILMTLGLGLLLINQRNVRYRE